METKRKQRLWIGRRQKYRSYTLLKELTEEDPAADRNHLRMTKNKFDELLEKIDTKIKKNTLMRDVIPTSTKLEIMLRYLAGGDSYQSLEY
ncbi:hypothetical protein PR048_001798 [Dryococelus australis]|uniref:Uncharacterized protein n=1 Tax=Dryococelus australis TaxID=614101 RepID=A0ABQ9IJR1_9NEOP|nr:hypothetical protein PR048_001798 [Dryococelus australis]